MKTKIIVSLLSLFTLLFVTAGSANAATSIRLEQPASPTNQDSFNITFVALDTDSTRAVTVQCYKKGPSDGSFVSFGPLITLSAGGNTDNCQVGGGLLNQNGTYQFEAIASGTSNPTSNIVNVDYNNSTPGNPYNYSKSKPDECTYKITFRTANDSGKTVKVALYRSNETSFSADSGHQVNSLSIGSDTDGSMTNNISPNCTTTYYFAIRAFDVYGNGSDVVGDSSTTTTVVNPTITGQQGAIAGGTGENIIGGETGGKGGEVLGTESATAKPSPTPTAQLNPITQAINWIMYGHKKVTAAALGLIAIAIAAGYYFYTRKFKKE